MGKSDSSSEKSEGGEEDSEAECSSTTEEPTWNCDGCGVDPIVGKRFRCQQCPFRCQHFPNSDLCITCNARRAVMHDEEHEFVEEVVSVGN
mmetsp:Transcript_122134/g.390622  ORF Transcript_122134/g.390622 Transcript_122134/m.390622 type:complete len:91 (-) Transcript_122134:197-469(-)